MTDIGKILVIVIVALSTVLLGISTVAYRTAVDWKGVVGKQSKQVTELEGAVQAASTALKTAEGQLDVAVKDHGVEVKARETKIRDLTDNNTKAIAEIGQAQAALKKAQEEAQAILADADARRKDTDGLKQSLAAVEAQSKLYKDQEAVLNDRILELTRMLQASETNAKVLDERLKTR